MSIARLAAADASDRKCTGDSHSVPSSCEAHDSCRNDVPAFPQWNGSKENWDVTSSALGPTTAAQEVTKQKESLLNRLRQQVLRTVSMV